MIGGRRWGSKHTCVEVCAHLPALYEADDLLRPPSLGDVRPLDTDGLGGELPSLGTDEVCASLGDDVNLDEMDDVLASFGDVAPSLGEEAPSALISLSGLALFASAACAGFEWSTVCRLSRNSSVGLYVK